MRTERSTEVIGIASGKGGVGKTSVSVNLATALTALGYKVMLFDADLGMANAQIALGCRTRHTFADVISGEKTLEEIIVTTPQGFQLVPGASGVQKMANLDRATLAGIVAAFSGLEQQIDYLVVDNAAGISDGVTTMMSASQRRFVVIRDEPASIADAYGTIKVLTQDYDLDEIYLIPNMVENQAAGRNLFARVNEVCGRFLGRTLNYLHSIEADEMVLRAQQRHQPVVQFAPGSAAARDFRLLAEATRRLNPLDQTSGGIQFFMERLVRRVPAE
jgi:flagellar biosynthesis protein FlhG